MNSRVCIYTRTGDCGASSLYTGERRAKDDAVFAALGDVDELNSHLGLASAYCQQEGNGLAPRLAEIQSRLLDVGTAVATPEKPVVAASARGGADGEGCMVPGGEAGEEGGGYAEGSGDSARRRRQHARFDPAHAATLEVRVRGWMERMDKEDYLPTN